MEIEERGVKLRLTIVDTPGYGDGMDNKDRYVLHSFWKVFTTLQISSLPRVFVFDIFC